MSLRPLASLALLVSGPALAWQGTTSTSAWTWSTSTSTLDPDAPAAGFQDLATLQAQAEVATQLSIGGEQRVLYTPASPVTFYGVSYADVGICANGVVEFGLPAAPCSGIVPTAWPSPVGR